jgi:uncharacterized membrane protein
MPFQVLSLNRRIMSHQPDPMPQMAKIVERNIDALLKLRNEQEEKRSREERIADTVTRFTGSMLFVYIHLIMFGTWIIWNLGLLGLLKPFDPSFVVLAMFASVEAIFLSTFVLISQNRMAAQSEKRAELDLQVSLLAEHEITRLITLVSSIARKMGIEDAYDREIEELSKDVHPEKVMETMEKLTKEHEEKLNK